MQMHHFNLSLLVPSVMVIGGCIIGDDNQGYRTEVKHRNESLSSATKKSQSSSGSHVVAGNSSRSSGPSSSSSSVGVLSGTTYAASSGTADASRSGGYVDTGSSRGELGIICYYLHADDRYTNNVIGFGPKYQYNNIDNDYAFAFYLSYEVYGLKEDTDFTIGINDYYGVMFGFEGKKYFNRANAYISPFGSFGIGVGALNWHYKNTLYDGDTGEEISGDALQFIHSTLGVGLEFGRSYSVKPTVQIGVFGRGYETETEQGFANDLIQGSYGFMASGSMSFQF